MNQQLGDVLTVIIIVVVYGTLVPVVYFAFKDMFIPDTKDAIKRIKESFKKR